MTAMYGERSAHLDQLFDALSKFQGDISNVERTRTGEFGLYADLGQCWATVRKALKEHGLSLTQPVLPYGSNGALAVVSHLGHSSGQYLISAIPLTPGMSLQKTAGEATYARRIAMAALLGLAADWDDDGTQAKKNHEEHRYANDTDRKWCEKAKAAIADAVQLENEELLAEISKKIEQAVKDGHISPQSKAMLDAFTKQVAEEVAHVE
jgi:hypothetical protein